MRCLRACRLLLLPIQVLVAILAGCSRPPISSSSIPMNYKSTQFDSISKAVFEYQISREYAGIGGIKNRNAYPYACFLWIEEAPHHDPSKRLLSYFPYKHPLVRKYSDAIQTQMGARDKSTGKYGMILFMGKVTWLSKDNVVTEPAGGANSPSGRITVIRQKDGNWKVTNEEHEPGSI